MKSDWDYPALPAFQHRVRRVSRTDGADDEARIAGFRFHPSAAQSTPEHEAQRYRERSYSSSDEGEVEPQAAGPSTVKSKKSNPAHGSFEPEQHRLSDRQLARRRKRRKDIAEEAHWNDGLAHWMARRDLWCGVTSAKAKVRENAKPRNDFIAGLHLDSSGSTPRTSTSSISGQLDLSTAPTTPELAATSPHRTAFDPATPEPLIPVMPLILPTHPIRRRMSPTMYTEIYTKVILQSRTPSVPINLQHLIAALIKGWKDDGEWPPKPNIPEPSLARKKRKDAGAKDGGGFRNGVKAVGRVLRLTGVSEVG